MMSEKPHLGRESTMAVTAKIGKDLLGGEKLGDTRQVTAQKKSKKLKKASTMSKTIEEAKAVLGKDVDVGAGRTLRKRVESAPKHTAKKRKAAGARTGGKKAKKSSEGPAGDSTVNSSA